MEIEGLSTGISGHGYWKGTAAPIDASTRRSVFGGSGKDFIRPAWLQHKVVSQIYLPHARRRPCSLLHPMWANVNSGRRIEPAAADGAAVPFALAEWLRRLATLAGWVTGWAGQLALPAAVANYVVSVLFGLLWYCHCCRGYPRGRDRSGSVSGSRCRCCWLLLWPLLLLVFFFFQLPAFSALLHSTPIHPS